MIDKLQHSFLIALILATAAFANKSKSDSAEFRKSLILVVGSQPSDMLYRTQGKSLFENKYFKSRWQSLLTPSEQMIVKNKLTVESSLEKKDGYYTFMRCKPHDCAENFIITYIDDETLSIIIYYSLVSGSRITKSVISKDYKTYSLPTKIREGIAQEGFVF